MPPPSLLARARVWSRSLTARLVGAVAVLVLSVTAVVGVVSGIAVRGYLLDDLDGKVGESLERTERFVSGDVDAQPPPGEMVGGEGPDADRQPRGDGVDQLTAAWDAEGAGAGDVLVQGEGGAISQRLLDDRALAALADLPADGEPRTVDVPGFGSYRVAVVAVGEGAIAVGLPTEDVDGVVDNLVALLALLVVLSVLGASAGGLLLVRRTLRPLREVAATAHAVAHVPLAEGEIELAERVPRRLTDEDTEVGRVGGALNTLLDHVETSLVARHRSEQRVRQFVADASHELRTPLATISGYSELARRHPDDERALRTALGKVEEESWRMTALVEDLLLLARLDSGRPLEVRPVDLTRLLMEAVADARVLAPGHLWRLDLPDDPVEVTGDEQRLHQVVTNLLTNARKYTPVGTTVTVGAGRDGSFWVHDTGPGFPPELVDHAFERFARADAARTRASGAGGAGGVGLGLALVKAIVVAHGGSVSLASGPGDTRVEVRLPRV